MIRENADHAPCNVPTTARHLETSVMPRKIPGVWGRAPFLKAPGHLEIHSQKSTIRADSNYDHSVVILGKSYDPNLVIPYDINSARNS